MKHPQETLKNLDTPPPPLKYFVVCVYINSTKRQCSTLNQDGFFTSLTGNCVLIQIAATQPQASGLNLASFICVLLQNCSPVATASQQNSFCDAILQRRLLLYKNVTFSKCATQIYTEFLKHPANVSLSNTWFHLDINGRANKIHSRHHFLLSPINDNGPHKRNRTTRCFVFVTFCLFPHISS